MPQLTRCLGCCTLKISHNRHGSLLSNAQLLRTLCEWVNVCAIENQQSLQFEPNRSTDWIYSLPLCSGYVVLADKCKVVLLNPAKIIYQTISKICATWQMIMWSQRGCGKYSQKTISEIYVKFLLVVRRKSQASAFTERTFCFWVFFCWHPK